MAADHPETNKLEARSDEMHDAILSIRCDFTGKRAESRLADMIIMEIPPDEFLSMVTGTTPFGGSENTRERFGYGFAVLNAFLNFKP
ncbi:MAG: hypothetical protein LBR53_06220 [Deltaproteobacteria bacterium]|jgi:hypothetical protein|nr:hypothetical protein [Deltaproteobacteria bacterium]